MLHNYLISISKKKVYTNIHISCMHQHICIEKLHELTFRHHIKLHYITYVLLHKPLIS